MNIPFALQVTDKWSKRRFALRFTEDTLPATVADIMTLLETTDARALREFHGNGRITEEGIAGFADIQEALFSINGDGTLGPPVDGAYLSYNGVPLAPEQSIPLEQRSVGAAGKKLYVCDLVLDRDAVPYTRNWKGYYRRKWSDRFQRLVVGWIHRFAPEEVDTILSLSGRKNVERFIRAVSTAVYNAPYELYSRYLGRKVPFKTASETLTSISQGRGGNCSEKASVIDFICANFGLEAHLCLSGHDAKGPFPEFHLRRALERSSTVFIGDNQRFWEHFANIITVEDTRFLVDATGGPMPFLLCDGTEAQRYLSHEQHLPVTFIDKDERYFYSDPPADISYGALYNMEAFIPDIDLYHIFGPEEEDAPFGLIITPELWVCPNAYRTDEEFNRHRTAWKTYGSAHRRITALEIYPSLSPATASPLLDGIEKRFPDCVADLRSIEATFLKRCRYCWRDDSWKIGYVFCTLQP